MTLIRWIINLAFGYVGFRLGVRLEADQLISDSPLPFLGIQSLNSLYLAAAIGAVGYLLSPALAIFLTRQWKISQDFLRKLAPEVPVAIAVGAGLGLLLTVLANNILGQVKGFLPIHSLIIATVLILFFSSLFVANREFFRLMKPPQSGGSRLKGGKILDTSVLIDGRIGDIADLGFLEGPLYVPKQVLKELQIFSDSSDPLKRGKGRRGLDTLERIKLSAGIEVLESQETDDPVDDQILAETKKLGASLVTNDHALAQLSRIYGVRTLSVQALAASLRTSIQTGDFLNLMISKEGKEPGQGIGYLDDGTLIVVEDAYQFKGKEVNVVITQTIQTQVGRMLFGRLQTENDKPIRQTLI